MTPTDNKAIVTRFVEAAQTRHDLTAIDQMMSAGFVDHSVPPGLPPDREGVKMQFSGELSVCRPRTNRSRLK